MEERVILVNERDEQLGLMPKMEAHEKGLLHRAFSVFLFNPEGELLLQQRALGKYHSPGLWTNTCCSHQRHGETSLEAGKRRLMEEMGIDCELQEAFSFIYKASFENGLTEHELDHVLVGTFAGDPNPDPKEVEDFKWLSIDELKVDMERHPENYTAWFKIIFKEYEERLPV